MFGYLIESEIASLDKVLKNPQRPLTAIMGGAKVSSKITIIENLLDKVDNLILGGGMTYTFVKAHGGEVGIPFANPIFLETALAIEKKAAEKGVKIFMATDVVAADAFCQMPIHRLLKPALFLTDGKGLMPVQTVSRCLKK